MNAITRLRAATRYTYAAWRVCPGSTDAHEIDVAAADSLPDAIAIAATSCSHKDTLFVCQTDQVEGIRLVTVQRLKARKVWRKCPDTLITKQFNDLFADEVTRFRASAFEPVGPWRWTPGCDVVGASRVVEG